MDADPTLDNYDRYDVIVGHNPSGTSVANMQHWRQAYLHRSFRYYDYGTKEANIKQYGSVYPPEWRVDDIRVPLRLFRGTSDLAADVDDVEYLWSKIVP